MLAEKYNELRKDGKKLEIIFVSSDRTEEEAKDYYGSHPWLMLDFADRDAKSKLSNKYGIQGIPSLILLDDKLEIITDDGRSAIMECPFEELKDYAEKKKAEEEKAALEMKELRENFSLSKLLDDQSVLDEDDNAVPLSTFGQAESITGIYFSAHWCGPCVAFTPELAKKYEELKAQGKKFDIIFVSFDRDVNNAKEYFADMPWKMLKYEKREEAMKLAEIFEVEGIPSLTLIDESGKLITNEGREVLFDPNTDFDKIKEQKTVFGM
jgi:nucleoredoxin